jgi:hypothetical protein
LKDASPVSIPDAIGFSIVPFILNLRKRMDRHLSKALVVCAKVLTAFVVIAVLLYIGSVIAAFTIYTPSKLPAPCCTAAKTTYTIIFRETDTVSCPNAEACSDIASTEIINGTLVLASDGSTVIGTTLGFCINNGPVAGTVASPGYVQSCQQEYVFNGAGGTTAGKLIAAGTYVVPTNVSDPTLYLLTRWAVTGGTGPYHFPNGGELTYTTVPTLAYHTVTLTELTVN